MNKNSRIALMLLIGITGSIPAHANTEKELKKMTGYTIIYGGYVQNTTEKNITEKYLHLDNGWIFKMNCLMLTPLSFTDVIVFAKKHSEELLKSVPDLPENLQFQLKILINKEVCDVTLMN